LGKRHDEVPAWQVFLAEYATDGGVRKPSVPTSSFAQITIGTTAVLPVELYDGGIKLGVVLHIVDMHSIYGLAGSGLLSRFVTRPLP
jgi:hypothetical protein